MLLFVAVKRQHLIYGLIDPETNELRYVGKSSNGVTRALDSVDPCLG